MLDEHALVEREGDIPTHSLLTYVEKQTQPERHLACTSADVRCN